MTSVMEPQDSGLRTILNKVRNKCAFQMAQTRALGSFKYYVGHDGEHLQHVWKNAESLIYDETSGEELKFLDIRFDFDRVHSSLNDVEKFILGASCYAHDLGMLAILPGNRGANEELLVENYDKSENTRDAHAGRSPTMINDYLGKTNIVKDDFLVEWVGHICSVHSNYPMEQKFKEVSMKEAQGRPKTAIAPADRGLIGREPFPPSILKKRSGKYPCYIRPALLSAILRLSDALFYSEVHTLRHIDIITKCLKKISQAMLRERKIIVGSYRHIQKKYKTSKLKERFDKFFPNLDTKRKEVVIPFVYKQIQEYWKHKITKSVVINHATENGEHIIEIKVDISPEESYPPFGKDYKAKSIPIEEVVQRKFKAEIDAVASVLAAYDVRTQYTPA